MPEHRPARSDRFSALLDRIAEGFLALDDQWRVLECNGRAASLLEAEREAVLGADLWSACPTLVESGLDERLRTAMDERESTAFEAYWPPTETRYHVRTYPTDDGGLEAYFRPVSGSVERVEEGTVVESLADGVLVVDGDDRIARVNEALTSLLDAGRGTLVGTQLGALSRATKLTEADVASLRTGVERVRASGRATADDDADDESAGEPSSTDGDCGPEDVRLQLELPGPEGRPGLVEIRLSQLPGSDRVAGVVRDVTERRDRERIIRAMHAATRELFRVDDPMDACAAAVHTGADLLDLQISGIWLFDEERNRLEPVAATAGAHDTVGGLPVFGHGEGLAWEAYQRGEALRFDDVHQVERAYNDDSPIRSELIVPIGQHGVLMAGDTTPGAFDETDLELAEILAANTEVVLDRLRREELLEERATELERQNERLASLEGVLDGPILAALGDIESTFDNGTIEEARAATDRARRLVDVAATYANRPGSTGARTGITLGEALDAAVRQTEITSLTTVVSRDGTLRADATLLQELLAAIVRNAAERDADVVSLGVLQATGSRARRLSGFSVEDDGDVIPRRVRTPPFDPYAGDVTVGLELELARLLARDHDWELTAQPTQVGMCFEITDVTTLSPTAQ